MAASEISSVSRTLEVGSQRAVITEGDDGALVIDLVDADGPDAGDSGGSSGERALPLPETQAILDDLAPGLAITPVPTAEPIIDLSDGIAVEWLVAAGTQVVYGPLRVIIPGSATVAIRINGVGLLTVTPAADIEASLHVQLAWMDDAWDLLEVYPSEDAAPFRYRIPLEADTRTALFAFDPLGRTAPEPLPDASTAFALDVSEDPGSGVAAAIPILANAAPPQQVRLRHTSTNTGPDSRIGIELHVDVSDLIPLPGTRPNPLVFSGEPALDRTHLVPDVAAHGGIDLSATGGAVEFAYPASGGATDIGFTWRVARDDGGPLFRLVTSAADHRIVVHPDAVATLHYSGISPDPIGFIVDRFEITKKGVVADARVDDAPVTLNGLNTAFRFTSGALQIRDGVAADFTLEGTGPLPPSLIGDATAQIAIRFSDRAGAVTPASAGAALTDEAPVTDAPAGFSYTVEAVDLDFERAGGAFHFYFRLSTGMTFTPPDSLGSAHVIANLAQASIGLIDAPLAGDASVLGDILDFVVELPEPATFDVLGCFSMKILAVGFEPAYAPFDDEPAILLAGQISFADGDGDKAVGVESRHRFAVGAPERGSVVPRVHFEEISVVIEKGDAFKLDAVVAFVDSADAEGFEGEGTLEIKGLPGLAIAVGFMRVRRPADNAWLRAWFIAANVSKLTVRIPSLELYLREVGLGFGYRYTLASIAAADRTENVGELLAELREMSRSQGDLATRDAWAVSLEEPDAEARWTIAMRALFSQGASPKSTPIRWDEASEARVPSAFLFDVVAAVRSDLTILLAARGWLNTNYHDYVTDDAGEIAGNPLFSGFALLEPRKQRFLAQISSNPNGHLGSRPPLPAFAAAAIRNSQIAATIMVEPNLFHAEIGWPNQLRWGMDFGPLRAEARAGLIYRVHHARNRTDLVVGISYAARASVRFEAGVSVGVAGIDLIATAEGAFGARLIGAAQLDRDAAEMQIYGAVGIDLRIRLELRVWIDFWLVTKRWTFALEMQFSASFALGVVAGAHTALGIRGQGTLRIRVLGRSFEVRARIEANGGIVDRARLATSQYLSLGLEADEDADMSIPGVEPVGMGSTPKLATDTGVDESARIGSLDGIGRNEEADGLQRAAPVAGTTPLSDRGLDVEIEPEPGPEPGPEPVPGPVLTTPDYRLYVVRPSGGPAYFVVYPIGDVGFLPPPPASRTAEHTVADFRIQFPPAPGLDPSAPPPVERWDPVDQVFVSLADGAYEWTARWDDPVYRDPDDPANVLTLSAYMGAAFVRDADGAVADPVPLEIDATLHDARVGEPTEHAYEAAVRGAIEQFRASPLFKPDPNSGYEAALAQALDPATTVYGGSVDEAGVPTSEGPRQARSLIVDEMISNVRDYAANPDNPGFDVATAPVFLMGLVFRADADLAWLAGEPDRDTPPDLAVRSGSDLTAARAVEVFNRLADDFAVRPPRLDGLRTFADASTIALAWDLKWDEVGARRHTDAQSSVRDDRAESHRGLDATDLRSDPEHHLAHYEVVRRALDDSSDHMTTTVKPAEVLHGGTPGEEFRVSALRPRFQFVDHFSHETPEEIAGLPRAGKSYVYTITPVDVNGSRGRAVTTVATRVPDEPPLVPVDTEVAIEYALDAVSFAPAPVDQGVPAPVRPTELRISWTQPAPPPGSFTVPIAEHRLVFRRTKTVAVGSYALDAFTATDLPSSHARLRPDDIIVPVPPRAAADGSHFEAQLEIDELQAAGVFPDGSWRPEAWRVYCQTVSETGVPSALVPVTLTLRFAAIDGGAVRGGAIRVGAQIEERRPPHLEWITRPLAMTPLPAQDGVARAIEMHVPQPDATPTGSGPGAANPIAYRPHPRGGRAIALRWNQVPSDGLANHPAELNAGYRLFRIDLDQLHAPPTSATGLASDAVEHLDDVRLVPDDELGLVPNTTRNVTEWEAWYPPRPLERLEGGAARRMKPDRSTHRLTWPHRSDMGELDADGARAYTATPEMLHPLLRRLLTDLGATYVVNVDAGRPADPGVTSSPSPQSPRTAAGFTARSLITRTSAGADPHGWAALQHLGLSMTLSLRTDGGRRRVPGGRALAATRELIAAYRTANIGDAEHLTLEMLVRADAALASAPSELGDEADAPLLEILQVSLRPLATPNGPTDPASETGPVSAAGEVARRTAEVTEFMASVDRALSTPSAVHSDPSPASDVDPATDWELYAAWTERFMDTAAIKGSPTGFLATAYPRPSAPALTAPDASGRVRHFDVVADGWAHAYRYIVQPFSRYDRLWQALASSPSFKEMLVQSDAQEPAGRGGSHSAQAGLDVLVPRSTPVAPPVIIHSRRLDATVAAPDGSPARTVPGSTWEIALAQHPEQALSELNLPLARRLDFRQVAWTMLRRFVVDSDGLAAVGIDPRSVVLPETRDPHLNSVPEDTIAAATDDPALTLAVTTRTGTFESAALALQVDHLPFFYEHQIIAVAQTSQLVSVPVHAVQREFAYISPGAHGIMRTIELDGVNVRVIAIPLARMWDSLSEAQQHAWPDEAPIRAARRPSSVPDLEVSYDILHVANATSTLVGRLFFDRPAEGRPRWQAAPALRGVHFAFLGGINADDGSHPDMSTRDRHGELELGLLTTSDVLAPIRAVVPDGAWAAALGARLIDPELSQDSDSSQGPGDALDTDDGDTSTGQLRSDQRPWYAGLVGVSLPEGASNVTAIPAVQAALARLEAASDGGGDAWTQFDPTRPLPELEELMGHVVISDGRAAYSALELTPASSDAEAGDVLRSITDAAAPPNFRRALDQLASSLATVANFDVEVPPGLNDVLPAHALDFPDPTRMSWNGHPDLLRVDRTGLGGALAETDLDVALAVERMLTRLDTTLPPRFVEFWADAGLEDRLANLPDDDEGRLILDSMTDAPRAAFAVAFELIGDDHPLIDHLDRLADAAAPDIRVSAETPLSRPTPQELDQISGGMLHYEPAAGSETGTLTWQGYAPTEVAADLADVECDGGFRRALEEVIAFLVRQQEPIVVELDPVLPLTTGIEDSALTDSVIISQHLLELDGFIDHNRVLELGAHATPAGRSALRSLYTRSLTGDLACGRLVIRTRRGSAPPGPPAEIEVAALEFEDGGGG